MINWGRQKKGKFIFCQRRGIASKTRQDDTADKPTVAPLTSIVDTLPHIVASPTYIVACAVDDSSSAGSRRGLFHPTDHVVAFTDGPTGLGGQGEKVRLLSAPLPRVSTLPRSYPPGALGPNPAGLCHLSAWTGFNPPALAASHSDTEKSPRRKAKASNYNRDSLSIETDCH